MATTTDVDYLRPPSASSGLSQENDHTSWSATPNGCGSDPKSTEEKPYVKMLRKSSGLQFCKKTYYIQLKGSVFCATTCLPVSRFLLFMIPLTLLNEVANTKTII